MLNNKRLNITVITVCETVWFTSFSVYLLLFCKPHCLYIYIYIYIYLSVTRESWTMYRKGCTCIRLILRHYHIICAKELKKTMNVTETVIFLFKFETGTYVQMYGRIIVIMWHCKLNTCTAKYRYTGMESNVLTAHCAWMSNLHKIRA
jgi:hypothetical protein